jgi:hypothetical protein
MKKKKTQVDVCNLDEETKDPVEEPTEAKSDKKGKKGSQTLKRSEEQNKRRGSKKRKKKGKCCVMMKKMAGGKKQDSLGCTIF